MGGEGKTRRRNRSGPPIRRQVEVVVVNDAELRRRQLRAIRNSLITLASRGGEPPTSDVGVGGGAARVAGLEGLMGPLEADVVRVIWAANAPLSARHVLRKLNEGRSRPLRYTTVQTVMARLARKRVLARSRHGRVDLYRAVAPDAASIAVSRLLAQFEEAAIRPFIEQASREPRLRAALRAALPLIP